MPADRYGVEELITGLDSNNVRLCPVHRLVFDADPVHYHGAGRTCPHSGEPLIGFLARWRGQDDSPEDMLPPEFWEAMG
jgi:hypothetical protein